MRTRSTALLLSGLAAATLLAACGGDSDSGSDGGDGGDGGDSGVDLVMTGNARLRWEPESATVEAGEVEIELRNTSGVQHNLYIVDAEGTELPTFLESGGMNDNPTGTFRLQPGSYTIICKIPGHADMQADLTVN